jgi:hypothetical protein
MKCMNNHECCKHGRRLNSFEWDCPLKALTATVFQDSDSVYVQIPGICADYKPRRLSAQEAVMVHGRYRPALQKRIK